MRMYNFMRMYPQTSLRSPVTGVGDLRLHDAATQRHRSKPNPNPFVPASFPNPFYTPTITIN